MADSFIMCTRRFRRAGGSGVKPRWNLAGKTVVVIGGGGALGREIGATFTGEGASVSIWDIEPEGKTEKKEPEEKSSTSRKNRPKKEAPAKKEAPGKKAPEKKAAPVKKAPPAKKEVKLECPTEGVTFKDDYNEYEVCDNCDLNKECKKAASGSKEDASNEVESKNETKGKSDEPSGDCPHGHDFGDDCNKENDCDECAEWESCQDAHDAAK